jgi:hypothetical protein
MLIELVKLLLLRHIKNMQKIKSKQDSHIKIRDVIHLTGYLTLSPVSVWLGDHLC